MKYQITHNNLRAGDEPGRFFYAESILALNASAIQRALTRIAHEIAERNDPGEGVVIIGIQRGGVMQPSACPVY